MACPRRGARWWLLRDRGALPCRLSAPNPFEAFLDDYGPCRSCPRIGCGVCAERAVRFFPEVLSIDLDPWQIEFVRAYGRGERKISVRACHGPGKTLVAAGCGWHTLLCRFPQHTVVTAPTKSQLYGAFMKEMKTIHSRLPEGLRGMYEVTNDLIAKKDTPSESRFEARTAREEKPEALQGVHCDEGWVLIIVDEASGVHERIFEAGVGSMSGKRVTTMLLSNPTRSTGYFADTHMKPGARENWLKIHVSADDSPRVSQEFRQEVADAYGRDSNAYRVRVLGEFPRSDLDTVIPFELVDSARGRDVVAAPGSPEVWGLDVARFGDDDTVLLRRNVREVLPTILFWNGLDLMQTVGRVKSLYDAAEVKPAEIMVDENGMGGGVLDRLFELGLPVRGVNVGEAASSKEKYKGLRSELWFTGKDWFAGLNRRLPRCDGGCAKECPHERLARELTLPKYKMGSDGRLFVEPKSDMKKRGHKSPNFADAFLLTLASDAATMMHGGNQNTWSRDISRALAPSLV